MQNHCCIDISLRIPFPDINRKVVIILCIILANTGCINYYKVNSNKVVKAADHEIPFDTSKQVVAHLKGTSYALKDVSINNNVLTGNLFDLSDQEVKYLHPSSRYRNHYKSTDADVIFNEVHVYAEGIEVPDSRKVSIPMDMISKVDVYKKNKGATIGSHVLGISLALITIIAIAGIIAVATWSGF